MTDNPPLPYRARIRQHDDYWYGELVTLVPFVGEVHDGTQRCSSREEAVESLRALYEEDCDFFDDWEDVDLHAPPPLDDAPADLGLRNRAMADEARARWGAVELPENVIELLERSAAYVDGAANRIEQLEGELSDLKQWVAGQGWANFKGAEQ